MLPHELLNDGFAPSPCEVLVMGCGNILRGDDAVGPRLIRHLWQGGVPEGARLVDGGTAGMDVAFQMQGAARVVIVDASSTGSPPGTIYRVPGDELLDLPPLTGIHTHSFRWDHALSFSRWLLGPRCPTDITVFLIEAGDLSPGEELTAPVHKAMEEVARLVRNEFFEDAATDMVELTADGYLHLSATLAGKYFPADVCGALLEGSTLYLLPIRSQANGGHLLKQRNASGDRSMLVREVLADEKRVGIFSTRWEEERGALAVELGGN